MSVLFSALLPILQNEGKFLFRSEKINTVLVVLFIIWVGIVVYLLLMGKKVSSLEKEVKEIKQEIEDKSPTP